MKRNISKKYIYNVLEYLFAFILILDFRSFWSRSENYRLLTGNKIAVFLVLVGILIMLYSGRSSRYRLNKTLILVFAVSLYLVFFMFVSNSNMATTIRFIMYIIILFLYQCFCHQNDKYGLLIKINDIVLVIAVVSLFFWVLGSILQVIKPTGIAITDWTGMEGVKRSVNSYYSIYFEPHDFSINGIKLVKNSAIFTEGPMASFIFTTALLCEMFLKKETSRFRVIVFSIAILSTVSTTGYVIVIASFVIKYLLTNKKGFWQVLRIIAFPSMLIIGIFVVQMILERKIATISGSIRMDDFKAGYRAWLDSPIWGNGIGNTMSYQKYMSKFRNYNLGFSNSIMNILALGGIMLFMPYMLGMIEIVKKALRKKDLYLLAFFVLFFIMFMMTLAPFQALIVYIYVVALDVINDNKNNQIIMRNI